MKQSKYLWLDLETTGLDPNKDVILEFCAVVTDADFVLHEQVGGVLHFDLAASLDALGCHTIDETVRHMHEVNELWALCSESRILLSDMEVALYELINSRYWENDKPILAGSSVHFDRGFLKVHCPKVEALLHYRHFDASTVKMLLEDMGRAPPKSTSKHRAASDLRDSMDLVRHARRAIC